MQCAHGPLFEGVLHTHQAVGVSQHPAGDALACRLRQSLCMIDPALFLLGKLHIHSSFSAARQRLFSFFYYSGLGLDYKLDLSGCRRMVFRFSGAVRLGSER